MNFTRSQITELITTSNALGSFNGDRLSSLQQNDLDPGEYTIQFQIVDPPIDNLGFATYAYISWKVDGQEISRIVSVFNGSSISGVAEAVDVHLQDQSGRGGFNLAGTFSVVNNSQYISATNSQTLKSGQQIQFTSQPGVFYTISNGMNGTSAVLDTPYTGTTNAATTAYALSKYKVAASLSRGTRATTMQPPVLLTIKEQAVPDNFATQNISFPLVDAGVISVLITTTSNVAAEAENCLAQFLDPTGSAITSYFPSEFSGWYPVPPGAVILQLVNQSTSKPAAFSIQWGIEG